MYMYYVFTSSKTFFSKVVFPEALGPYTKKFIFAFKNLFKLF